MLLVKPTNYDALCAFVPGLIVSFESLRFEAKVQFKPVASRMELKTKQGQN
jgi:hypothetical protein